MSRAVPHGCTLVFFFGREDRLWTSTSCANRVEARRDRLSRCTREYGAFDLLDLLKYEQPYDLGDDSSIIEAHFEYGTAVDVLLKLPSGIPTFCRAAQQPGKHMADLRNPPDSS